MRLHDIESAVLLPRFAHSAEWEQKALDQVVKGVRAKSFAMGAPYTREAISALSDAELQAFYFQYGIANYYPDLSRETRENMLFELARVYRSLGTPHSVELLCEYIFDGADKVVVEIHDNLAFNAAGELVDDSLLDLFDVDLFPTSPTLSQDKIERIVENIFRFCRNSQTLRDIIIEFPDVAELPIASCDLESFVYTIGGDEIAEEPQPVVVLPTVTEAGYVSIYPNHSNFYPDVVNEGRVWDYSSSQWVESSYDSTKTYAAVDWSAENSQSGFYGIQISEYNGHLGLKNVLSKIIVRYIESKYAVCDSASASVVAVYGNGVIYNAFKYTANNTDYYYVLDGTQTDWTDNLSGLGYVLYTGEIEILLGFKWNDAGTELVSVNDLSNDYYWARVISQADRDLLSAMGIASNIESYLKYGGLLYNSYYTYSFVAIYSDMGETVAPLHDPSNCLIRSYSSGARVVIGLYYDGTSSEAVMAWKCRITRNL